mgnify:CR=1 FL=1
MGFRFQKRIKILPGVSINLSKSGVSTSVGPPGAKVTFGNGKTRTTVGLPGTGISHTSVVSDRSDTHPIPSAAPSVIGSIFGVLGGVLIGLIGGVALFFVSLVFGSGKKSRRR